MGGGALIVVDTHVLVWLDSADRRLGERARHAVDAALKRQELAASAISFWEIALLQNRGRLSSAKSLGAWRSDLLEKGLQEIPIDGAIGIAAARLSEVHGDPADRLIAATALSAGTLVTADQNLLRWETDLRRIDARR